MSGRQRFAEIALWLALLLLATMLGASVYQRISLIPEWGGSLPQSVVTYFHGTSAGASIDRFWRSVIPPTTLLMIVAVWANRPALSRRK
jgi:putative copper export protein